MKAFLAACAVIVGVAVGASFVLEQQYQSQVDRTFTGASVRLGTH